MKIPLSLQVSAASSSKAPLVCKLKKSLYRLKQPSTQWFSKLSEALLSRGYISRKNDYSLFTKRTSTSLVVLVVYVDDILLARSGISEMSSLKSFLDQQFKINDLGLVHYFLGIEVITHDSGYLITQQKYTSDLLEEFLCSQFTSAFSPLDPTAKLTSDMAVPLPDPSLCRRLVGKLNFLQPTRPDISFVVHHLSQFVNPPCNPHMLVGLHVLKYLSFVPDEGIFLPVISSMGLIAYVDSDWAACTLSR